MGHRATKQLFIALLISLSCAGCDQLSKHYAKSELRYRSAQSYLDNTIRLQYAENSGVAFSLGAGLPRYLRTILFIIGPALCLIGLLVFIVWHRPHELSSLLGLSMILGGGIGNLIDRLVHDGRVIDFLNLGIGQTFRTAIFNLADAAITAGMVLLIVSALLSARREKFLPEQ